MVSDFVFVKLPKVKDRLLFLGLRNTNLLEAIWRSEPFVLSFLDLTQEVDPLILFDLNDLSWGEVVTILMQNTLPFMARVFLMLYPCFFLFLSAFIMLFVDLSFQLARLSLSFL